MDREFWIERWKRGETGFHQQQGNDLLLKHWASLQVPPGVPVFVPLCGKSVDLVWLAAQGRKVIGAELSPLAVGDFFKEQNLTPDVRQDGAFEVYTAGPITIWCGDFFALEPKVTAGAVVYDRAALVAMPPTMQRDYANKLLDLAPAAAILLVSLSYPDGQITGPPFSTLGEQVRALFEVTHDINIAETRDGLAASPALKDRGVTALEETAYVMTPRATTAATAKS